MMWDRRGSSPVGSGRSQFVSSVSEEMESSAVLQLT